MPIQPVPPINPPLPPFPGPNTPEDQYDDTSYAWGTALPPHSERLHEIGEVTYNNALEAKDQAEAADAARQLAETATTNALSAMNFKGDWANLAGPLSRPATVQHNNSVWLLMRDVANVAVEVPGVSTAWVNQTARVSSVMGRTGDVVGLAETAAPSLGTAAMSTAPLGQWATFNSSGTAGADWPTSLGTAWWNVFTFGTGTRKTQRATQIYAGGQQGWVFERQLHDSTWSSWQRIFGDKSVIERVKLYTSPGSAVTIDPADGSLQMVGLNANLTVTLPNPRDMGDQLTIRFYQPASWTIAFGANVKMPVGASLPSLSANEWLTLSFIPDNNKNMWFLFIGGKHPG